MNSDQPDKPADPFVSDGTDGQRKGTFKKGGPRRGGNKKGSQHKSTIKLRAIQARLVIDGNTPLEYLAAIMTNQKASPDRRDRAAIAMLPFMHAKRSPQPAVDARPPGEVAAEIRSALAAMREATSPATIPDEPSDASSDSGPSGTGATKH